MGPWSAWVLLPEVNIFIGCPAGILVAYLYRLNYSKCIEVSNQRHGAESLNSFS